MKKYCIEYEVWVCDARFDTTQSDKVKDLSKDYDVDDLIDIQDVRSKFFEEVANYLDDELAFTDYNEASVEVKETVVTTVYDDNDTDDMLDQYSDFGTFYKKYSTLTGKFTRH